MSPTNLSTRALVAEHDVHHPREVLVQLRDDLLGLPLLGDRREAADVGEEHRHLAPLPAEPRERRDSRRAARRRPSTRTGRTAASSSASRALDEVLIADAAEQRDRDGEHRLRQVQPVAAARRAASRPTRTPRRTSDRGAGRPPRRQDRRDDADHQRQHATTVASRDAGRAPARMKRFDRMSSATAAWIWMPGILPPRERRLEDVEQPRRRHADEHDLVPEDRRIDVRLLAGEDLLLRVQQVEERVVGYVRLFRSASSAGPRKLIEPPQVARRRPPRCRRAATASGIARSPMLQHRARRGGRRRRDAGRRAARPRRRATAARGRRDAHERHRVPQRAVGIEHEQVVPEPGRRRRPAPRTAGRSTCRSAMPGDVERDSRRPARPARRLRSPSKVASASRMTLPAAFTESTSAWSDSAPDTCRRRTRSRCACRLRRS